MISHHSCVILYMELSQQTCEFQSHRYIMMGPWIKAEITVPGSHLPSQPVVASDSYSTTWWIIPLSK